VFGNTQQPAQQPSAGGLFGGGTTGGLFGNTQQNQQQPAQTSAFGSGGLFGSKPPATAPAPGSGGIFGGLGQTNNTSNTTQPSTGLFGSTFGQNNAQQNNAGASALGGGLFGQKPAAPAFGTTPSSGQTGGGLFGSTLGGAANTFTASAAAPGAVGTLTASIAQPIGASLPVFNMLPPGPRAIPLDQPKKKAGFFTDVPTRSPVPRLQLGFTPANTKLRGFASTTGGANLGSSLAFSTSKMDVLNLSRSSSPNKGMPGPDVFLNGGGTGGSGGRQSVKKLVLNKKVDPSHLLGRAGSPGAAGTGSKVTFSPTLSIAARQKEAEAAAALPKPESPQPRNASSRFTPSGVDTPSDGTLDANPSEPQEGEYWSKPDLATLRKTSYHELRSFKGLVVGRVGYGQVEFLEPVDLTGVPRLDALLGHLILFEDKECAVYPNSDEADKPPQGEGLNVAARITLVKCWAQNKATREPIKDKEHPAAIKHQKRLEKMKNTTFESFDIGEGKWVFRVDGF
jgi:nuclear pore complex protein Nup98-Nup96